MQPLRRLLLVVALLATAIIAGFFYAYSVSVMPGLTASDPVSAINAMKAINAVVRTVEFAVSFFGALALPILCLLLARRPPVVLALIAAILLYGIGAFAVTLAFNVPLNEALAGTTPTQASATQIWSAYVEPWLMWNHIRMAASIAAFLAMAVALVADFRDLSRA
jgi:uncharacterized membrane protein